MTLASSNTSTFTAPLPAMTWLVSPKMLATTGASLTGVIETVDVSASAALLSLLPLPAPESVTAVRVTTRVLPVVGLSELLR